MKIILITRDGLGRAIKVPRSLIIWVSGTIGAISLGFVLLLAHTLHTRSMSNELLDQWRDKIDYQKLLQLPD